MGNWLWIKSPDSSLCRMGLTKIWWDSPFSKVVSPGTHLSRILVRTLNSVAIEGISVSHTLLVYFCLAFIVSDFDFADPAEQDIPHTPTSSKGAQNILHTPASATDTQHVLHTPTSATDAQDMSTDPATSSDEQDTAQESKKEASKQKVRILLLLDFS